MSYASPRERKAIPVLPEKGKAFWGIFRAARRKSSTHKEKRIASPKGCACQARIRPPFDRGPRLAYCPNPMNGPPIAPEAPWLAPIAGYSDLPFRLLCRRLGAAAAVTEMVSVKGLLFRQPGTQKLLATCPEDSPLVIQLFGAKPEHFAPVMQGLIGQGFCLFDLNAGCPVRKVVKTGSGSALLAEPERLLAIARVMVRAAVAAGGRVGVKLRLGFESGRDDVLDIGRALEQAGVSWLTLHPRFGRQMFTGRADWARLGALVRAVRIPVLASGDLHTAEDAIRCLAETNAAGVMFARGALHDPRVFERFAALVRGRPAPDPDPAGLAGVARAHVRLAKSLDGSEASLRKVRSFVPRYAKGLDGIRALRAKLSACRSWEELEAAAALIAGLAPIRPAG